MSLTGISRRSTGRRNKYSARRCYQDGCRFDSEAERARYMELKLMERAGAISMLVVHPRYPIEVNGARVCVYEPDFVYRDQYGQTVVEDVKGVRTALYKLKKKLFEAVHGLAITEVNISP